MRIDKALVGAAAGMLLEAKVQREHGSAQVYRPSQVLPEVDCPVAVDTEGSGLHVDDGARPSVVVVSWEEEGIPRTDGEPGWRVRSYAFPFDQGGSGNGGKPIRTNKYDSAQGDLFVDGAPDGEAPELNLPIEEYLWILDWIRRRVLVIMHNAKHDMHQFRVGPTRWKDDPRVRLDFVEEGIPVWDAMVVNRELWPLALVGLGASCERLKLTVDGGGGKSDTGDAVKTWLRRRNLPAGRYDLVPWDIMGPYASSDGELTVRLYYRQVEEIQHRLQPRVTDGDEGDGYETEETYELRNRGLADWMVPRELRVTGVLYQMEKRGLPFDVGGCLEAAAELEVAQAKVAAQLPFDPSSAKDTIRYYFGKKSDGGVLGLVPYSVTAKRGDPQLTEEVLRKMLRDGVPYAAELAEYNKIGTALEMWYRAYPAFIGEDGRLRTSFRQVKVSSGRFSVERFQAQALPHDHRLEVGALQQVPTVRSLVGAGVPAGYRLWEVDLAQAELRVAAVAAQCYRMIRMVENGDDLHGVTARELFAVDSDSKDWFKYRQVSKRGNFSFIFGVGADTFRATVAKLLGIEFSMAESERIVQSWNGIYPEYKRTIYQVMREVRGRQDRYGTGWVNLVNGRRRWFEPYEETHKAFNQYVQASLAELGKDWMLNTEREYPGVLLLTVHDSQVLMTPEDTGDEIPQAIAKWVAAYGSEMFGIAMEADVKPWNVH